MKSAFVTSSGDAFVLKNFLHYYETVWKDEVDELWVALNTTMEKSVVAEIIKDIPDGVKILYVNRRLGYGKPLNFLLEFSPEGNVLLLEDDTIIFKKGVVTKYFDLLEQYDLIGSPRMSCPKEVADKLEEEFGLNYEGRGDKGPNFWPCFLWTKKELLLKTDRNFDPTEWGDTFVWMSVQLRRLTNNILEIPQYHCSPDDFINRENGWGIFDGECGYMHLGSLSSGIESYLLDENNVPLSDRAAGIKCEDPKPIDNSPEMQKRLSWWLKCYRNATQRNNFYYQVYYRALKDAIDRSGIEMSDIAKWSEMYEEVLRS